MELRQLRAFVAVAEERSFTRAADRLYVVQSAVSATVQTLERELAVTLLDRSARPLALTDAGRVLLEEARRTLAAADAALAAVEEVRGGLRGTVRLGIMHRRRGAVSTAQVIRRFEEAHPAVRVVTRHVGGSAEMAEHVRDGELDLGILALPGGGPHGISLTELSREPMLFICHREHPLAGEAEIRLIHLAEAVFVDVPATWGTRIAFEAALGAAGIEREVRYEINELGGLLDFVEQGLAVAVLPDSFVNPHPDLRLVPITDSPAFVVSLAISSERELTPAAAAFAQVILAVAAAPDRPQHA